MQLAALSCQAISWGYFQELLPQSLGCIMLRSTSIALQLWNKEANYKPYRQVITLHKPHLRVYCKHSLAKTHNQRHTWCTTRLNQPCTCQCTYNQVDLIMAPGTLQLAYKGQQCSRQILQSTYAQPKQVTTITINVITSEKCFISIIISAILCYHLQCVLCHSSPLVY